MSVSTRQAPHAQHTEHAEQTPTTWVEANHQTLRLELERLRLLLRRRVLWLRTQWANDAETASRGFAIGDRQADRLLAPQAPEHEQLFYAQDTACAAVQQALAELEERLTRRRQALAAAGVPSALDRLVRLFHLSPFERDLLLLCLALELDPSFAILYGYLHDDATRKHATAELALALFVQQESAWPAAHASLAADAPLRRFLLIDLEPNLGAGLPEASRPLRLSPRIAGFLLGSNRLSPECYELLEELRPILLPAAYDQLAVDVREWLDRRPDRGGAQELPAVHLVGPDVGGRRAVARSLCERLGLPVLELELDRLPPSGEERQRALRLLEREATLLQSALYLDAGEAGGAKEAERRARVAELADNLTAMVLVGSAERLPTARGALSVPLRRLDAGQQLELWQRGLAARGVTLDGTSGGIDALVQQFDFGPEAIAQVLAAVTSDGAFDRAPEGAADTRPPTLRDLWRACREQAAGRLDDLAQRITPQHTWDDIVLPHDVDQQLREIAAQVANRTLVYERWGFGAKLERGRGISALFSGPSGTGKTLAAEILAHHLDLDLYRIDLSGVVSKYIGETEKNLRRVFDAAEQSGAILFFDEADALFGKRSEVKDSHDRYANIEINYLLQRMEDYRGLAILATNMKAHIDPAFMRRLRFLVDFPFPDAVHRKRIWRRVLPELAPLEDVDLDTLARLEVSGGNIRSIALNAAFLAAEHGGPIRMEHLAHATRREYSKLEKLMHGAEFRDAALASSSVGNDQGRTR